MKQSCGYTKLEKEDPEDANHRRAQFLIYKVMQQVDKQQQQHHPLVSTTSFIRIRLCRLKIKLRKGVLLSVSAARFRIYRQLRIHWKRLFRRPLAHTVAAASIFPSL
ncbi:hypothetical protein LINGRAHAP2_LOCUS5291 [Linum grandiflorum]